MNRKKNRQDARIAKELARMPSTSSDLILPPYRRSSGVREALAALAILPRGMNVAKVGTGIR
jgi:hypothetical protein